MGFRWCAAPSDWSDRWWGLSAAIGSPPSPKLLKVLIGGQKYILFCAVVFRFENVLYVLTCILHVLNYVRTTFKNENINGQFFRPHKFLNRYFKSLSVWTNKFSNNTVKLGVDADCFKNGHPTPLHPPPLHRRFLFTPLPLLVNTARRSGGSSKLFRADGNQLFV